MSVVSIAITDGDRKVLDRCYARYLETALQDATRLARMMSGPQHPHLYLRDALGGLHGEVKWK